MTSNQNKKQIVFLEYSPMIHTLKMAKGLKDTGRYETVLVAFNKLDKEFFKIGYDKIINFEISQRLSLKNFFNLTRKIFTKERKKFFEELKNLDPYIVQIVGLGLFSFLANFLIKRKTPRIYYAYDIIAFHDIKKNDFNIGKLDLSFFSGSLKRLEKYYFKTSAGIVHKGPKNELSFLKYSVDTPDLALLPGCLEEWTYLPKKKKTKEIHVVFAGAPHEEIYYTYPFKELVKRLTSQKIHLHTYGKAYKKSNDLYFSNEDKKNPFFHYHDKLNPEKFNKEISNYTYGIIPDEFNDLIDPLWAKTSTGHKMYNYLEAGLPIIMVRGLMPMAEVVEKYKVGICIGYEDTRRLRSILNNVNYKKLQNNVKIAQKKLSIGEITKDLENFYEKVASNK